MKVQLITIVAFAGLLAGCASTPSPADRPETLPDAASESAPADTRAAALAAAVEGAWRDPANRARDNFRHPYQTLEFFGIEPDMCVVELWPAGGWYAEILAPLLKDDGHYVAAHFSPISEHRLANYFKRSRAAFEQRIADEAEVFGKVQVVSMEIGVDNQMPTHGRADMVLTFRNAHNWLRDGIFDEVLQSVHAALKPGGILGSSTTGLTRRCRSTRRPGTAMSTKPK